MLSKHVAEEFGIHIGDGCMGIYPKTGHYDYTVCGGMEDYKYLTEYVKPLIRKLYHLYPNKPTKKKGNSFDMVYCSKSLINWKMKMGLPVGRKDDITIPKVILNSTFVLDCLRGIFDTDGSITFKKRHKQKHYYPVIKLGSKSKPLMICKPA